jgi:hypothetical protein
MVLKTKSQLFLNVNKLEIGLLMNGFFPNTTLLNCNNPIQIGKKAAIPRHKRSCSQNQSISKEVFQRGYQMRPVDMGLVPPNGLRENQ